MAFYRYERKKTAKGNNPFDLKKVVYYGYQEIDDLIGKLSEEGYDCVCTQEGILGSGSWLCISPEPGYYHFEIREIPLNEWQSGHTVRRFQKISKRQEEMIENAWREF